MSEKRPETDADIVTRAQAVWDAGVDNAPRSRARRYNVDLPAHMAECDANYHRLLQIFPRLQAPGEQCLALQLPALEATVSFRVTERGRYTTTLEIDMHGGQSWLKLATGLHLTVRVYHDARSAEVTGYQKQNRFHGKYEYPNRGMRQRDEKAQLNRFLSEFLSLCLAQGATTSPVSF